MVVQDGLIIVVNPEGTGLRQENDYTRNVVEECPLVQTLKAFNPRSVISRTR